jgi:hypothetical protein
MGETWLWTLGFALAVLTPIIIGRVLARGTGTAPSQGRTIEPGILFVGVGSQQMPPLDLTREMQQIQDVVRAAGAGARIEVWSEWGTDVAALGRAILNRKPGILHFSGHGTPAGELLFGPDGEQAVPTEALQMLLGPLHKYVTCVVLNSCNSHIQAKQLSESVDLVIGMRAEIEDPLARKFTVGFYGALAQGEDFATAFELASAAILADAGDPNMAVMFPGAGFRPEQARLRLTRE